MKILFFIYFLTIINNDLVFSQNRFINIQRAITKDIKFQNDIFGIKNELNRFWILGNPDTYELKLMKPKVLTPREKELAKKYSDKELIQIIQQKLFPIYPTKDTIFIIDSCELFKDYVSNRTSKVRIVSNKFFKTIDTKVSLCLFSAQNHEGYFVVTIGNYINGMFKNYYFSFKNGIYYLAKTEVADGDYD
ncbi:MAG: hypothetical protein ABI851_07615 [Saprospiraceae bacterium]